MAIAEYQVAIKGKPLSGRVGLDFYVVLVATDPDHHDKAVLAATRKHVIHQLLEQYGSSIPPGISFDDIELKRV